MTGIIKLEITESPQELLELVKKAENKEVKERVQILYWLKTKQVESVGAIASLTGVHRTTVSRWLSKYRQGGIKNLLKKGKSTGRKSVFTSELKAKIVQELEDPQGFSSYKEVQKWLEIVENVEISYTGVHKFIRYKLKSKLKVPRPVHSKQEEGAVEKFKKN